MINENNEKLLREQLFKAVLNLKDVVECENFFEDLCTNQEIKSLSQRLEVARLIDEGEIYDNIVKATGASSATISRVKRFLIYGSNGYKVILKRLKEIS